MISRLRFLLPLVLSGFAAPVAAAEPPQQAYIRCVQSELSALGASGVAVSGKLNGATKSAALAVQKQHGSNRGVALLPRLSDTSAVSWCRELAVLKPGLKKYMPSASKPLFAGTGGAGSVQTALIATAFTNVERFFQSRYGIHLASRVDVAGSDSGKELTQLAVGLQRSRGISFGGMSRSVSRNCGSPSLYYSGIAYLDQLLICWKRMPRYDQAWHKKVYPKISAIMAHEYMHHLQRELTNSKVWKSSYRSQRKMGPAWMVEGGAEVAEYDWRTTRGGYRKLSLQELLKPAAKSKKGLRAMQEHRSVKGAEQYLTARFAVYLLSRRYGDQAVLDYWRYVGQGKSWEAAFRNAFGLSIGSYYTEFETMRRNPELASAFLAGK